MGNSRGLTIAVIVAVCSSVISIGAIVVGAADVETLLAGPAVAGFVLLLFWMRSMNRALRGLGVRGLRYSPWGTVLWWFVPVANLFAPYRAMSELWQASNPRLLRHWRRTNRSSVLSWWWGLYLASAISLNFVDRFPEATEGTLALVAVLLFVTSECLTAWLVWTIHRRAFEKATR